MAKAPLTNDSEFVVGEEKAINYVMAVFFIALFLYGVIDAARHQFKNIDYQSYIFALAIAPAVYCFRRANSKRVYLRINKTGIYKDEQLVTGWSNLIKFYLTQEKKKSFYNILDNFILVVEFSDTDPQKGIRKKIPLTNTQNKSEEDVLATVDFFWQQYKKTTGM